MTASARSSTVRVVTQEVRTKAKRGMVRRLRDWVKRRHWLWLVVVFLGWQTVQAAAVATVAFVGGLIPFIGPAALAGATAWVDDFIVFTYATIVGPELLRRLGVWSDED